MKMFLFNKEDFAQGVYQIVRHIPFGRATSYGAIARAMGYPNMSRMVGRIMGECPSSLDIPAHRVVNSQGVLSGSGAFGGADEMQKLLEKEGLKIVSNRICNWRSVFWNPLEEIKIEE